MRILSGKELAGVIEEEMKQETGVLREEGLRPTLAVIMVGEDPATQIYVRNKHKAAERVGIETVDCHLPATVTQAELEEKVREFNNDPRVHGLLCQLPLPEQLVEERITRLIEPLKDVDCFHPYNFGLMAMGVPRFLPCTPAGIMEILGRYEIEVSGKRVVVIGRSNIVGRPMSLLLGRHGVDATVTVCHSRTREIEETARRAEVLIVAVGRPEWVTGEMVGEGAVVVDVGMHRVDDPSRKKGFRLCGDVERASVEPKVSALTPVPGGVGPMTITMLLKNTIHAARLSRG